MGNGSGRAAFPGALGKMDFHRPSLGERRLGCKVLGACQHEGRLGGVFWGHDGAVRVRTPQCHRVSLRATMSPFRVIVSPFSAIVSPSEALCPPLESLCPPQSHHVPISAIVSPSEPSCPPQCCVPLRAIVSPFSAIVSPSEPPHPPSGCHHSKAQHPEPPPSHPTPKRTNFKKKHPNTLNPR